jgi:hypothetical protein
MLGMTRGMEIGGYPPPIVLRLRAAVCYCSGALKTTSTFRLTERGYDSCSAQGSWFSPGARFL